MKYSNIREEELKNKVADDYFWLYDCTKIIGNIDFCVAVHKAKPDHKEFFEHESLLWAEAKKGKSDVYKSMVQLILTIGKARTFDAHLPPAFIGAFDAEQIAFIGYSDISDIFYQNDFNWNITPSNYNTKEFNTVLKRVTEILDRNALLFAFGKDDKELNRFIKDNFVVSKHGITKTKIDKNNFMVIYNKWLQVVKPTILVNWDAVKVAGIIDGDFYLADLLSSENQSLKEKLSVLLKHDYYELDRHVDETKLFSSKRANFSDGQKAHTQFWNRYERPPKEEYWDYIIGRRDLLVPQDVRERKGSFFTPQPWVELSQRYLADTLGENWQDEYVVWDCAAGTGNLLAGLTNKYNIWASTLDKQDVDVMKDRIKNGANLLEDQVFQFDFLNDDFTKLPKALQAIINDPKRRKKLIIYINPPYAEHGNRTTISDHGEHKTSVANKTKVYNEFSSIVGTATRELSAQFFLRIYRDFPESILASFSTVKFINSQNFSKFRSFFKAVYKKGFICNANSFDNVKGNFPIGFFIWDLKSKHEIDCVETEVIENEIQRGKKSFYAVDNKYFISNWLRKYYDKSSNPIGYLILPGVDMQQQNGVYFTLKPTDSDIEQHKTAFVTDKNIKEMVIYLAIRQCISPDWKNNKDQFLYPNDGWEKDTEFQNDCLAFALFHGQNKITSREGTNHWIPFTEEEVGSRSSFESTFMTDFIAGKVEPASHGGDLFTTKAPKKPKPLKFSAEAKAVFRAGKALWQYYHQQRGSNPNASLYDIREYFQGRNEKGKMNNKSTDEVYTELIGELRQSLRHLSQKLEPKVYEYGFLKQ